MHGGEGNDTLDGGAGDDYLNRRRNNDIYQFSGSGLGADTLEDFDGIDTLDFGAFSGSVTIDLGVSAAQTIDSGDLTLTLVEDEEDHVLIENVIGSAGADVITGNQLDNIIDGCAGSDTLVGVGGHDRLEGGLGDDALSAIDDETIDVSYVFEGSGLGTDTLGNPGSDIVTLDFSEFDAGVTLNRASSNVTLSGLTLVSVHMAAHLSNYR